MTREEAIELLEDLDGAIEDNHGRDYDEAFRMAIEALNSVTASENDLIKRQDALKPFCIAPDGTRIPEVDCDNFPVEFSVEFIKKHLLSLPSADTDMSEYCDRLWKIAYERGKAEAVQGEWEFDTVIPIGGGAYSAGYRCSNCGANYFKVDGMSFCPNCGARMKGENRDIRKPNNSNKNANR